MDDRNDLLRDLLFGVLTSYIASCLFAMNTSLLAWLSPRVATALEWLRSHLRSRRRVLQLSGTIVSNSTAYGSLTTSSDTRIEVPSGKIMLTTAPEPLPAGTAGAIAMAMQPPPLPPRSPLPQFINNSHWIHWEAAQREQHQGALSAIASARRSVAHLL